MDHGLYYLKDHERAEWSKKLILKVMVTPIISIWKPSEFDDTLLSEKKKMKEKRIARENIPR